MLQMVTACHPRCPRELLNHRFEAGSSSHHKEKCQKRVTAGGERESRHPSCLLLVFSLPLSTNFHCASPASTEKGNLKETAYAFCSKVLSFLLHSLSFSRSSTKSDHQSCDSLHCFFVFDSKTHKKSRQLYRCVNAIISATNILHSEYSWKEFMAAIASTGTPQTPHQALGLPDPIARWCQTSQLYPSHRPHKKSFRVELTSHFQSQASRIQQCSNSQQSSPSA